MRPRRLTDAEIEAGLSALPEWERRGDAIVRTFTFGSFPDGITWVARVAEVAEAMQHHPDLDIRYTRITATLSTHDAGGLTAQDLELARALSELAPARPD